MNRHTNRDNRIKVEGDEEPWVFNAVLAALLGLAVTVACILAFEGGALLR